MGSFWPRAARHAGCPDAGLRAHAGPAGLRASSALGSGLATEERVSERALALVQLTY